MRHPPKLPQAQLNRKREIRLEKTLSNTSGRCPTYDLSRPQDKLFGKAFQFFSQLRQRLKLEALQNQEDRTGTFRREIAQERPNYEFFSLGNDFFDFITNGMMGDVFGRSYAIECRSQSNPW